MLLHIKDGATAKLTVYENAAFPNTHPVPLTTNQKSVLRRFAGRALAIFVDVSAMIQRWRTSPTQTSKLIDSRWKRRGAPQ
jgi:hypothetical protein